MVGICHLDSNEVWTQILFSLISQCDLVSLISLSICYYTLNPILGSLNGPPEAKFGRYSSSVFGLEYTLEETAVLRYGRVCYIHSYQD